MLGHTKLYLREMAPVTPHLAPTPLPPNESRGFIINMVGWVGAALATVFIGLRIYSRNWITKSAGWEDAIIVFAGALNITTVALGSVSIHYGIGGHIYYMTKENVVKALYYTTVGRPFAIMDYCIPKLSVVIPVMRLMGPNRKRHDTIILYTVITVIFVTSISSIIIFFAQCNPPSHLWESLAPGKCLPARVHDVVTYITGGTCLPRYLIESTS
jgi:hypothetical protein